VAAVAARAAQVLQVGTSVALAVAVSTFLLLLVVQLITVLVEEAVVRVIQIPRVLLVAQAAAVLAGHQTWLQVKEQPTAAVAVVVVPDKPIRLAVRAGLVLFTSDSAHEPNHVLRRTVSTRHY
jgi:hypothetical protein